MAEIFDNQYMKIVKDVREIIMSDDQDRAFESVGIIKEFLKRKGLEKTNPDLFAAYNKLIVQLKWVALPMFNEEEIAEMFNRNLEETFNMEDFDLWQKFRTVLIAVIVLHQDRDRFKERIKSILNKGTGILTSAKLSGNVLPTTENWIKDYTATVGLGIAESVKIQNYFNNSENYKKLRPEEKEKIKGFFQFYERLKLSSMTVAGIEETVPIPVDDKGTMGYIRDGKIEKETPLPPEVQRIFDAVMGIKKAEEPVVGSIIPKVKIKPIDEAKLAELQQTVNKYPAGSLERKAVEAEIKKMGGSPKL